MSPVCASVCVCVCVSVTAFYLNNIRPILMKLGPHDLNKILRRHFSQILKMLIRWRHSGRFICFRMRHSHGRNFASILFKFIDKKVWFLSMFAIENQQNQFVSCAEKADCIYTFLVFQPGSEVLSILGRGRIGKVLKLEFFLLCLKIIVIGYKKG